MVLHSIKERLLSAGKLCIEVAPTSKVSWISEELCIGCGICVKVSSQQPMCHICPHAAAVIDHQLDCYHLLYRNALSMLS